MTATVNEMTQPQVRSLESPKKIVSAANGVDYAFRELGDGAVPLVLLQHFRGNLDYWDPALIDALAVGRRCDYVRQFGRWQFQRNDAEHRHTNGTRRRRIPRCDRSR